MLGAFHILAQGHGPEDRVEDENDGQDEKLSELVNFGPVLEDVVLVGGGGFIVDPVLLLLRLTLLMGREKVADEQLVLILLDCVLCKKMKSHTCKFMLGLFLKSLYCIFFVPAQLTFF